MDIKIIKFNFKNTDFRKTVRTLFSEYKKLYKKQFLYSITTEDILKIILMMSEKTFLPLEDISEINESNNRDNFWFVESKSLKKKDFSSLTKRYKLKKKDTSIEEILYIYIKFMLQKIKEQS